MAKLSFQPANSVDKDPFFMFVSPMPATGPCRTAPTLPRPQPPCFDADAPCSTKQAPAPRETARFGLQDGPYGKPIRHVFATRCMAGHYQRWKAWGCLGSLQMLMPKRDI